MIITKDYTGSRLDKFTSNYLNIPHSLASKLVRKGQIKINGKKVAISTRLIEGDEVLFPNSVKLIPKKAKKGENFISEKMLEEFKNLIIFETTDFFAINKPSGLATQGGTGVRLSVDDFLVKLNPEFRLVHRLDKETSGVMIIAKNRSSAMQIAGDFYKRGLEKKYLAITHGIPTYKTGTINHSLQKEDQQVKVDLSGKSSVTHYKVIGIFEDFALMELAIETGRMHQIRVHLASIGCKIIGDEKYGDITSKIAIEFSGKMFLHSLSIKYQNNEIRAKVPNYFEALMKKIIYLDK